MPSQFDTGSQAAQPWSDQSHPLSSAPADSSTRTSSTSPPSAVPPTVSPAAPPVAAVPSAPALRFDLSPAPPPSYATAPGSHPLQGGTATAKGKERKGIAGVLTAIGAFLLKFGAVLAKFKFLLFAPKLLLTMGSMLVSIWAYSLLWGWKFATGFVLLIFVHEMGHVLVAWYKKLPVSAPMFIPFLGALITLKQSPRDALTESQVGYGGPFFGGLGCAAVWIAGLSMHEPLLLAVAGFGMMVNLFNLVPVSPLDGGRIVTAIDPRFWLVGLVGMTAWFFYTHSPIMLVAIVLGATRLFSQWKTMNSSQYYQVATQDRITMALLYIGLIVFLAWGHSAIYQTLQSWLHLSASSAAYIN